MGNEQGRVLSPEEMKAREIREMDSEMRKKFSKTAIKYNLKVILKGDRNTGKTSLWRRLQGLPFLEEYLPTPEIQTAHINWSYKATDDVIKVEIWDCVDKAKPKKKTSGGLKVQEEDDDDEPQQPQLPGPDHKGSFVMSNLDAGTIDVYQGTQAVILMMDPTKKWTWDYVHREVPKIPKGIYILLLGNFRDMGDHRVVSDFEIKDFCKRHEGGMIKYLEASMLNGYGLKSIVSFFNIPFLVMQRQVLQAQLDRNQEEISSAEDELKLISTEQNYAFYLKWLESSRKQRIEKKHAAHPNTDSISPPPSPAPIALSNSTNGVPQNNSLSSSGSGAFTTKVVNKNERTASIIGKSSDESINNPSNPTTTTPPTNSNNSTPQVANTNHPTQTPTQTQTQTQTPTPTPSIPVAEPVKKSFSFFSKITDMMSKVTKTDAPSTTSSHSNEETSNNSNKEEEGPVDIENFKPGEIDDGFFGEEKSPRNKKAPPPKQQPSNAAPLKKAPAKDQDSDDDFNPMVAQDADLDEEDSKPMKVALPVKKAAPVKKQETKPEVKPEAKKEIKQEPKQETKPTPIPIPTKSAPKPTPKDDSDDDFNPMVAPDEELDEEDSKPMKVVQPAKVPTAAPTKKNSPTPQPKFNPPQKTPTPTPSPKPSVPEKKVEPVIDSDDDDFNPMVAPDQDLDEQDSKPVVVPPPKKIPIVSNPSSPRRVETPPAKVIVPEPKVVESKEQEHEDENEVEVVKDQEVDLDWGEASVQELEQTKQIENGGNEIVEEIVDESSFTSTNDDWGVETKKEKSHHDRERRHRSDRGDKDKDKDRERRHRSEKDKERDKDDSKKERSRRSERSERSEKSDKSKDKDKDRERSSRKPKKEDSPSPTSTKSLEEQELDDFYAD